MRLRTIITAAALLACSALASAQGVNLFRDAEVAVGSQQDGYPAGNINDGLLDRSSTWMPNRWKRPPYIAEINLNTYCKIDSLVIYTGIPESEMKASEQGKAAGFWCMKNFIVQYWDDANWTDIAETLTSENRLDRIVFSFPTPVTSWRFRLYCTDGEAMRIREIEGYGVKDLSVAAPLLSGVPRTVEEITVPDVLEIRPDADHTVGQTMHYVGYNQGYFVPGGNARAWWEYSGVNVARLWADLKTYVHPQWLAATEAVSCLEEFEARKAAFLADGASRVPFGEIAGVAATVVPTTNTMALDYAMKTLRELGVEAVIQSSIGRDCYGATWADKWDLWQRFFCFAYYTCKVGGITMWAMCNEPNHRNAGPMPLDSWIALSKVVKDAINCAVALVNSELGTSYKGRFVGPVTAGTNTNWWSAIAASQRTDYRGQTIDEDIIDLFSTHSYNIPAAGYIGRMDMMNGIISGNHPQHTTSPIVFTETGRWMNAYLIDKEETMDSPSLFVEWAGMYTRNMLGGCYGMWAFKFANTASSTYPRGIKSGHHLTWKGGRFSEDSFTNLALGAAVSASCNAADARAVTDGDKCSAWVSSAEGDKWLRLDFDGPVKVGGIALYTGTEGGELTAPDRIRAYTLELLTADGKTVGVTTQKANRYAQQFHTVSPAVDAVALRLVSKDDGSSKVREIKVFGENTIGAAPESFNVAGLQRTAEVVRLFAKGFKGDRPLVRLDCSFEDRDVDAVASKDGAKVYFWLVNRVTKDISCRIDLSSLGIKAGDPVVVETVDATHYGEAALLRAGEGGVLNLPMGSQSVNLVTVTPCPEGTGSIKCSSVRTVRLAGKKGRSVEMNYSDKSANAVTYLSFDLRKMKLSENGRVLLRIDGKSEGRDMFRFHVYGFDGRASVGKAWDKAPYLADDESLVESENPDIFVAGEFVVTGEGGCRYLDVTDAVRRHCGGGVTFILARELRESGDDYDNGCGAQLDKKNKPQLIYW